MTLSSSQRWWGFADRYGLTMGIIVGVFVLAAGIFFAILPLWRNVQTMSGAVRDQKEQELSALLTKLSQLEKAQKSLENLTETEITRLASLIPAEKNLPQLYQDLDKTAQDLGMAVLSMSAIETAASATAAEATAESPAAAPPSEVEELQIQMSLSYSGEYNDFKKLIDRIEHHVPLLSMSVLDFQPGNNQIDLTLETYFLGD